MDWRIRMAKLAIIGRIPFGDHARRAKRRVFGYSPDKENLLGTLRDLDQMQAALSELGRSFSGATVLEIGSGWFPTIPITLAVRGAKRVLMSDLVPHMDEVTFAATLKFLVENTQAQPRRTTESRIEDFPLTYLAPFRIADVADQSIDFIISRTVLEHIPRAALIDLLRALRPKLSPQGLMLHLVDHSDHLEHADKSLSKVNFLTWSNRKHALVNWLTKEGENRLRHHQYQQVFDEAGYGIAQFSTQLHEPTRALVKTLKLVAPFRGMTPDEISILSSLFVLSPRTKVDPKFETII